jgi:cobalt/nickel transport protein
MSENPKSTRSWLINLGLLAAAAAIFVVCLTIGQSASGDESEESFVGTDTTAVTAIEEGHPDYEPWFAQVFAPPSAEVESGLFALQAALGAGVFGYALGALRRRRGSESSVGGNRS